MGQQTVLIFLEKNKGKWFTAKEIAGEIGQSLSSIQNNLKRLRGSYPLCYTRNLKWGYGNKYMVK